MSGNGTITKVHEVTCARLNPLEVIAGWDVLYWSLMGSGMFKEQHHVAALLHDAATTKLDLWILKTRDEEDNPHLVGVVCSKVFYSPYTGERAITLQHAHVSDAYVTADAWRNVLQPLVAYAKKRGCTFAEVYSENARAQRLLEKFGFKRVGAFRREL